MTKCHDQGNLWKKISIHGLWLQRVRVTIMVGTLQEAGRHLAESKSTLIRNSTGCWNLQAHSQWQIPSNKATPPSQTRLSTWDKYSNIRAFLCEPPHIVSLPRFNFSLLAFCFLGSNWSLLSAIILIFFIRTKSLICPGKHYNSQCTRVLNLPEMLRHS